MPGTWKDEKGVIEKKKKFPTKKRTIRSRWLGKKHPTPGYPMRQHLAMVTEWRVMKGEGGVKLKERKRKGKQNEGAVRTSTT